MFKALLSKFLAIASKTNKHHWRCTIQTPDYCGAVVELGCGLLPPRCCRFMSSAERLPMEESEHEGGSADRVIAESDDVVECDGYPYFPRAAVRMEWLEKSREDGRGPALPARRAVLRRGARRHPPRARGLVVRGAARLDGAGRPPHGLLASGRAGLSARIQLRHGAESRPGQPSVRKASSQRRTKAAAIAQSARNSAPMRQSRGASTAARRGRGCPRAARPG